MKNVRMLGGLAVLGLATLFTTSFAADGEFHKLFNGRDMTGFQFVPAAVKDAFKVEDATIVCSGKPFGYFVTDKSYKNYVIKYDWKFARPADLKDEEKFPGNSGLLVGIVSTQHKGSWPNCLEVQG